ncbi:winged helix DNA-binding domain-containing protein, partial [Paenibacillus koleovorans]|uniref:winged helix DNA-binding domain-containing protein n=1 Tax=Paenibacillus koleovorans TaxID=121608 RepID=UPI0013E2F8E0
DAPGDGGNTAEDCGLASPSSTAANVGADAPGDGGNTAEDCGLARASNTAAHDAANSAGALDALVRRYLAAFGPASPKDMQAWSGLTRLREAFERLRPQLYTCLDEQGVELFDLPDAPRPSAETPAPVRFLGEFDNILLSHDDRSRIMPEPYKKRVFTINGIIRASFLVDGFVRGLWRMETSTDGNTATLVLEAFEPLTEADRAALTAEGRQLLVFAAAEADSHAIRFLD